MPAFLSLYHIPESRWRAVLLRPELIQVASPLFKLCGARDIIGSRGAVNVEEGKEVGGSDVGVIT